MFAQATLTNHTDLTAEAVAWYRGAIRAVTERTMNAPEHKLEEVDLRALRLRLRAMISALLRLPQADPDVEDVLQETLRRAVESSRPHEVPFDRWAVGIARHVAIDCIRKKQRERAHFEPLPERQSGFDLAATEGEASDPIEEQERTARFQKAMEALPEGQRHVVELFHKEGLSYEEIAKRLSVPKGTVATWLMRAKTSLYAAMREKRL